MSTEQARRARLEQLLRGKLAEPPRRYPLAPNQITVWFQQQVEPDSSAYNVPLVFMIAGELRVEILHRSLEEIIRRHRVLRSTYHDSDHGPEMIVAPMTPLSLPVIDRTELPQSQWHDEALAQSREQASEAMSLSVGPLYRMKLVRFTPERHALLVTAHHIVMDGWSVGVLLRELTDAYMAFNQNKPSPLPALPLQFEDFVSSEQRRLSHTTIGEQVNYWKRRLEDAPAALELPTDFARPPVQSFRGAHVGFKIPLALTRSLKAVGQKVHATFFMTLLAAFYVWLHKLSGQEDIVLGVAHANRDRRELWPLLGMFANTIAMRAQIHPDETFLEMLARVRAQALDDYEHADAPLPRLVEELKPVRDPSRSVLFQAGFDMQNSPWPTLFEDGVGMADVISLLDSDAGAAKLDLNLSLSENERGIIGQLEYSTDLFRESTVRCYLDGFLVLLEKLVRSPGERLRDLTLLEDDAFDEASSADRAASVAPNESLVGLLRPEWPDRVAIRAGERKLTYRELHQRADAWAHRLNAAGVAGGMLVGLCSERSIEQLVAVLAILKAGGAYVPIDPQWPVERVAYVAEDAGLSLILASARESGRLQWGDRTVLTLEHLPVSAAATPPTDYTVDPAQLAYLIYTSGSTGRPKGVMVTHGSVATYARAAADLIDLRADDRVLQFASLSFDASAEEIFPCWSRGATLVLRDDDMISTPQMLLAACQELELSVLDLPTAYWHELVRAMDADELVLPASIRTVIIGGEAAQAAELSRWCALVDARVRLYNTYGPTESTIVATASCWERGQTVDPRCPVSIGHPVGAARVQILDAEMQPVPDGVVGEIHVGGPGVARGYWRRPSLTAECFLPDPRSCGAGARLYRTGDLGRRLASGEIEFKGRVDSQVKIRGYRVELGEIEATLREHPDLGEVLVYLRDVQSAQRLVACVAPAAGTRPTGADIREWLSLRLPDYMIPAAFVVLESFPRTSSGKTDRKALMACTPATVDLTRAFAAPRTPAEEIMADIWQKVLRVERVGVYDNFFELGGHSLLATQVLSRVRRVMGVVVPLAALFEAPTIARFVQVLEGCRWLGQGIAPPPIASLPRTADGDQYFTQSFAQQRLWFLDELEPGMATYNIPSALRMTGELDVRALEAALNEIIRRHESLRTTFEQRDDQPLQRVHPAMPVLVPVYDLSSLQPPAREARLRELADEEVHRPFNIAQGPLLRMTVVRTGELEYVSLFTMHHIVSDAWSMGVLVQEVAALYRAFHQGEPSPLEPLTLQYADFAEWQRAWLSGERLEQQLDYWRVRLADVPAFLNLPTDRQLAPTRSLAGASAVGFLDAALTEAVKRLSRVENVTPFMFLLAAFKTLLFRYTHQTDLLVGSVIANRHREELEPLIGFFVNTLVMRTDVSGNPSFRELLHRVRDNALGAYAHQDLPFEKLVEHLGAGRRWSGTPLFRVMFVLQNAPMPALELPGLRLEPLPLDNRTTKFDLTLELIERLDGFVVIAQYSEDLFARSTIERLLGHFEELLRSIVSAPETRLGMLEFLAAPELTQLHEWSGDVRVPNHSIVSVFQSQVLVAPDALAVGSLTYGDLDRVSNRLARRLLSLGVERESRVGVCVREPAAFVSAALAILKAGGVYVPLDPSYPAARLRYLLEDSAPAVLIVDDQVALPDFPAPRVHVNEPCDCADAALDLQILPEQLAYLIYTSGSTGKPKGVACTHGGVVNLIDDMNRRAPLPPRHRGAVFASVSFDASVYEMFAGLLTGGSLHWVPADRRADPQRLADWMAEAGIESAYIPPFLLAQWAEHAPRLLQMKRLFVGVEPIDERLLRTLRARVPGLRIINAYGPTESTVVAAAYDVIEGDDPTLGTAPIGTPVQGLTLYVLDGEGLPVPIGVSGELHVGGAGLARGYWQRPALTAERFVPTTSGARLYRTGDRVRWRADGQLEFLGRVDEQVKVRGYRIEPAEIESVLQREPGIRRALVIAEAESSGTRRLIAYLESNEPVDLTSLRQALKASLPEFMMPSAFVVLPAFPQTAHGKIDKRALPAPQVESDPSTHQPPRTSLEEQLCAIWSEVLQRPRVGITENFFELGGHSLLATQVISRIRNSLRIELPLHGLFEEPTVAALAHGIESQRWAQSALPAPELQGVARTSEADQVFLQSFAQQRLWFMEQLEPGTATYNIPSAVRLRGALDVAALERSIEALVERHEAFRTTFALTEAGPVQRVSVAGATAFALIETNEADLTQALEQEGQRPFDLERGPLLRITVYRLSATEHVMLSVIHHIVADGWSIGVLVKELSALYTAFARQLPSPLAPLTLSSSAFFMRQHEWLARGALDKQLAYWSRRLADAPPVMELPADRARTREQSEQGSTVYTVISPDRVTRLKELSQREGGTLFMVLVAVFKVLLSRYTGQRDIVIGTPIANRHWQEVESLIGHFTNAVTLRTDLGGNPTFRALLGRVRETALGAYANQDLPFEKLVEHIGQERRWSRTPIFQVMFVLQNTPAPELALGDLQTAAVTVANRTTMFDLTLELVEHPYGLVAAFQYSTDLFERATIERMLGHYERLLDAVLDVPDRRIGELTLVDPETLRQVPGGAVDAGRFESLPAWFDRQAELTPDAPAVALAGGICMTYRQLRDRSNQVAHLLREQGVAAEKRVGVLLMRGTRLVSTLLGVLKAGGAYVPLDPAYPPDRIRYLMEDADIELLLTESVFTQLQAGPGRATIDLDRQERYLRSLPTTSPASTPEPEHLAYLIYTSGSTGRPKGVMIEHRNLSAFLRWTLEAFTDAEMTRVLASTSVCFDLCVFELFAPLIRGGGACIVRNAFDLTADEPVTLINTVPSIMSDLLRSGSVGVTVRTINLAGEALPLALVNAIHANLAGVRVVNLYGPSEDTTYSTIYDVPAGTDSPPLIGRAISESQACVLDENLQPVPSGVVGNIYLSGAGLARGYLGKPMATAEGFVPNPYSVEPGARLYNTGDRGRLRADGQLEYIGRADHQIKLRGCRIELGEIESVLMQHAEVSKAVVVARDDPSGQPQLVAYIVPRKRRSGAHASDWLDWLRERLPEYMVPAACVPMDALPVNSNGKVDRKALPDPVAYDTSSRSFVAPTTEAERFVAEVWASFLDAERIGLHDSFFELGGHSLLATQILSRVRRILGVDVPVRRFFAAPTVRGLLDIATEMAGDGDRLETIAATYREVMTRTVSN